MVKSDNTTWRFRRRVYLQLELDRYFGMSPPRPCFVNDLPLELLVEILVYVSHDTTHTEQRHCDPFTLPETGQFTRDGIDARANCMADLLFYRGCENFCYTMPWNWLEVTRVCKTWYRAAHSSAEFWSRIPIQTSVALSRSLQLAGALPLLLHATFDDHWPAPHHRMDRIRFQLHRTREISLSWKSVYVKTWPSVETLLLPAVPVLRRLCLEASTQYTLWVHYLFGGVTPPKLQEVQLVNFGLSKIDNCSRIFAPTLTSLTLSNCVFECERGLFEHGEEELIVEPWSKTSLFDALFMMPLLESLIIINTRMPKDLTQNDFIPPARPPTLPHLGKLELQGSVRLLTRFLANIVIPSTASLELCFKHETERFDVDPFIDLPGVRVFLEKHLHSSDPTRHNVYYSKSSLELNLESESYIEQHVGYAFTNPRDASEYTLPSRIALRHEWDWRAEYVAQIRAFAVSLCEVVPHDGPELSLEVNHFHPIESGHSDETSLYDWYQPTRVMNSVTMLHLRRYAGVEFLTWWRRGAWSQQQTKGAHLPSYAHLRSLKFTDECNISQDSLILSHLLRLLEGHLFVVEIQGCRIDSAAYNCLRGLLGNMLQCVERDNRWTCPGKANTGPKIDGYFRS